ncbi:MAG: hypothetical protein HOP20_09180 [Sulfuriferula sp.]|nr:hypothetical protein [Sulfuriferula sp.]
MDSLPRLAAALMAGDVNLNYIIEGGVAVRPYLRLKLTADLPLLCHRCAQIFKWHLDTECQVWLAQNEAELDVWDKVADGLADAMLAEDKFDWQAWLEEEVLLALPVSPVHPDDGCLATAEQGKSERPNPFAVLATLKRQH